MLLQEQTSRSTPQNLESLGLSAREAEVTARAISGATNVSIGETMYISPATVKRHLENVYAKLGVKGRGELAAFVHDALVPEFAGRKYAKRRIAWRHLCGEDWDLRRLVSG